MLVRENESDKFAKFNKLRKYINSAYYNSDNKLYAFLKFINVSFEDFFNNYFISC